MQNDIHSFSPSGIIYLLRKVVFSSFFFFYIEISQTPSTPCCTLDTRKALNEYRGDFAMPSGFIQVYGFKPLKNVLHTNYFTTFQIITSSFPLPTYTDMKRHIIFTFTVIFQIPFRNFHLPYHDFYPLSHTISKWSQTIIRFKYKHFEN